MRNQMTVTAFGIISVFALTGPAVGDVMEQAARASEEGDHRTAVRLMASEIEKNPGHEEAYELLAGAQEELGDKEAAAQTWATLKKITRVEARIAAARVGLLRTRGPVRPPIDRDRFADWDGDPFRVPVGRINFDEMGKIPADAYDGDTPAYVSRTKNFIIYAPNQITADTGAELSEKYLSFLLDRFLDGRAWARRVPVVIYETKDDYVSKGGWPAASAGVTRSDHLGRSDAVALYLMRDGAVYEHAIIGVLPHELTHVVINEFFGAQDTPRWLHEAIARRMEQDRRHYAMAARVGRDAVAGEYYRLRELFAAENYPDGYSKVIRFYEQSATIVLFLLEQGSESMVAFLQALKDGEGHDAAASAALGIPKEGAVEILEQRWVEWMKDRFVHDLSESDRGERFDVAPTEEVLFDSSKELAALSRIINWSPIPTGTLDHFRSVGDSLRDWKSERDALVYNAGSGAAVSILGVRMNEEQPLVLTCKVRRAGGRSGAVLFGFTMLDHRSDDTGAQVLVPLVDGRVHQLTCLIRDEIVLYLDGDTCTGRAPALRGDLLDEDIDYPLALVAHGPVEVSEIRAARLAADNLRLADGSD